MHDPDLLGVTAMSNDHTGDFSSILSLSALSGDSKVNACLYSLACVGFHVSDLLKTAS